MSVLSEKGNKTRALIIETARELFHRQGVRATSIDQILEASGTGKSQFYHYFGSKDEIVHEVLRFYLDIFRSGKAPVKVQIENWDDLESFFLDHVKTIKKYDYERSCPIGSIGGELASENENVRRDVNLVFEYVRDNISSFFDELKSRGELKESADPQSMADFCIASVQGALLVSKVRKDSEAAENTVAHAIKHLESYRKIRSSDS